MFVAKFHFFALISFSFASNKFSLNFDFEKSHSQRSKNDENDALCDEQLKMFSDALSARELWSLKCKIDLKRLEDLKYLNLF